jgi:hypothetical protein
METEHPNSSFSLDASSAGLQIEAPSLRELVPGYPISKNPGMILPIIFMGTVIVVFHIRTNCIIIKR